MSSGIHRPRLLNKDLNQLEKDVLLSIMRDWVYHAAGLRSPWESQYKYLKRSYRLAGYRTERLPLEIKDEWHGPLPSMIDVLMLCLRIPENLIDDPEDGIEEFLSMHPVERWSVINRTLHEGGTTEHLPTVPMLLKRITKRESHISKVRKLVGQYPHGDALDVYRSSIESAGRHAPTRARVKSEFVQHTAPRERQQFSTLEGVAPLHHPSKLPLSFTPDSPSVIFLSQLIPKKFCVSERAVILSLLQQQSNPRIPSCIVSGGGQQYTSYFGTLQDNRYRLSSFNLSMGNASSTVSHSSAASSNLESSMENFQHPLGPSGGGWPLGVIPAEVYKILAKHIPRDDLVAMRLVCREFERNISASVFESAVVPFRSEIFGMVLASQQPQDLPADNANTCELYVRECTPSDVDVGMRVFQGWGPHIRNFALAFEVDEELLAEPPIKQSFELHNSFWGTYEWPYPNYNWFAITAAQERTADKKHCMTQALSYLSIVKELGLSLDSGLGWLNGPDCSDRAIIFSKKPTVFGAQNKLPCRVTTEKHKLWAAICDSGEPWYYNLYTSYPNPDQKFLARYIELLFETKLLNEECLNFILDFMKHNPVGKLTLRLSTDIEACLNRRAVSLGWSHLGSDGIALKQVRHGIQSLIRRGRESNSRPHILQLGRPLGFASIPRSALEYLGIVRDICRVTDATIEPVVSDDEEDDVEVDIPTDNLVTQDMLLAQVPQALQPEIPLIFEGVNYDEYINHDIPEQPSTPFRDLDSWGFTPAMRNLAANLANYYELPDIYPPHNHKQLKPTNMKNAQKQWLMETELAQRAFLSSYILAVVDNRSTFVRILTLNLAKMSSRYLASFDRTDFWDSLPSLKSLIIMVSPDWRDVYRGYSDNVTLQKIETTTAVDQLMTVLENQIAGRRSIKVLKLGYVGGGEHATGLFARNQHILPAPIYDNLRNPSRDVSANSSRKDPTQILLFPYVEEMSFENCWVVPRVLVAFVTLMKKYSLRKLKLNSVSIPVYGGAHSVDAIVSTSPRAATEEEAGVIPGTVEDFGLPQSTPGQAHPERPPTESPKPTSDPARVNDYLDRAPRETTWVRIIDDITPGRTTDMLRNLGEPSEGRSAGSLEEIEFKSCGYVKLGGQEMKQDWITPMTTNEVLTERVNRLKDYMLTPTPTDSMYLGQIVPGMTTHEQDYLIRGLGMTMGWGDNPKQFHNREDNQRVGGLGRFSGKASRVVWG